MNPVFQAAQEPVFLSSKRGIEDIVETCLVRTAEALSVSKCASNQEIIKALTRVRESQAEGRPEDLIEVLARVLGNDEEHFSSAIKELSDSVASTLNPAPPTIPCASKLIAPSAFYDSFDTMHKLGKALLVPVVYAEDSDAIGTGSINPIAAQILSEEIHHAVGKRFGIRPFMTSARMEYESWAFLCRKHFEL